MSMLSVPISTQILLIAVILTACLVFVHEIPAYLIWGVLILGVVQLLGRRARFHQNLDKPEPRICKAKKEAVWAQIDQVLRTYKSTSKHVSLSIDYNNSEPSPGEPIFVQATITIHHPQLNDDSIKNFLDDEHKDLKSRVILKAYVSPVKDSTSGRSQMLLDWEVQPILTRWVEDGVIADISNQINTLVSKLEKKG